jgi:DNA-binding MarR family transcriptional regulator
MLALRSLRPDAPAPMGELAELLRCDSSNVTGIVDRLEERGLVERRGAPHDRRLKMVAVTERGARVRRLLTERLDEPPPELAALTLEDQILLRDVLRRALGQEP